MKLSDLIIDPASLGKRFWLVDVIPSYAYQNGQRTDTVTGYRYTVALPDKGLDKINVRIDGDQQMDAPVSFVEVRFAELEPYLYWSGGEYHLGARAIAVPRVLLHGGRDRVNRHASHACFSVPPFAGALAHGQEPVPDRAH